MQLRLYPLLLGLVNLIGLVSCQSTGSEPVASGDDYFPLEMGRYVIYDVQEHQYGLNTPSVQRTYQLKEVIGAAYTDVTGQSAYRLIRYRRANESKPWQADSVWSARIRNNEAIRTENGVDFIKLMFPVTNQLTWNGNRYNSFESAEYTARNVGQSYDVVDKPFKETVTVVAQNDSTLISQDKRIDVYARQIGLIYQERTQLQFCTATPACLGRSQIDYGIRQLYRIRTYGKE